MKYIRSIFSKKNKKPLDKNEEKDLKSILSTNGMLFDSGAIRHANLEKNIKQYVEVINNIRNIDDDNVLFQKLFHFFVNDRIMRMSYPGHSSFVSKKSIVESYRSIEGLYDITKKIHDSLESENEVDLISKYYGPAIMAEYDKVGICPQTLTEEIDCLVTSFDDVSNPIEFISLTKRSLKLFLEEREHVLLEKKRQLIKTDSYGFSDDSLWEKEKSKIVENYIYKIALKKVSFPVNSCNAYVMVRVLHEAMSCFDTCLNLEGSDEFITNNSKEKGESYERDCLDLLKENSWVVLTTSSPGDKGVDLIAIKNGIKLVIQCKNWKAKVGTSAVQEVYTGKSIYKADAAVILSETELTRQAMEIAEDLNIILISKSEINLLDFILENKLF